MCEHIPSLSHLLSRLSYNIHCRYLFATHNSRLTFALHRSLMDPQGAQPRQAILSAKPLERKNKSPCPRSRFRNDRGSYLPPWGIVTSVAGLSSPSTYRFSSQTQLITGVTITHQYTRTHDFTPDSLRDAEALENRLYFPSYQTRVMAFAPLACNSFGQQAPEIDTNG